MNAEPDEQGDPWGPDPRHPLTRARDTALMIVGLVAMSAAGFYGFQLLRSGPAVLSPEEQFEATWGTVVRAIPSGAAGGEPVEADRAVARQYASFCDDADRLGIDPSPELMAAWTAAVERLNARVRDAEGLWHGPGRWHRDLAEKPAK